MGTKQKVVATKAKATKGKKDALLTGSGLRAAVGKALKVTKATKAKATKVLSAAMQSGDITKATPAVEVVDVTGEVMGALERQAKATKAKATKAKATKAKATPVADVVTLANAGIPPHVAVEMTVDVDAEAKAADAVFAYAEKLGIDIGDVVKVAKSCEEYDMLVGLAGMEVNDRVVWLAGQKAREFDTRVVRPNGPKTGLGAVPSAKRGAAKGKGSSASKARVTLFGHAATAVIRALKASAGMGFEQIRNVLNAMGADSVADATIRCQMAGGGLKRGEPAPLTTAQINEAKAVASAAVAA